MEHESIDAKLRDAIAQRSLVMFEYADLARVVEPHRYGINSAGNPMLSGWLRAGYSRSDPSGGWRNYLLADMHAVQRLDAPFVGARPGYAAHDARMLEVLAELPPASRDVPLADGPFVVREAGDVTSHTPLADMPSREESHRPPRTQDGDTGASSTHRG